MPVSMGLQSILDKRDSLASKEIVPLRAEARLSKVYLIARTPFSQMNMATLY